MQPGKMHAVIVWHQGCNVLFGFVLFLATSRIFLEIPRGYKRVCAFVCIVQSSCPRCVIRFGSINATLPANHSRNAIRPSVQYVGHNCHCCYCPFYLDNRSLSVMYNQCARAIDLQVLPSVVSLFLLLLLDRCLLAWCPRSVCICIPKGIGGNKTRREGGLLLLRLRPRRRPPRASVGRGRCVVVVSSPRYMMMEGAERGESSSSTLSPYRPRLDEEKSIVLSGWGLFFAPPVIKEPKRPSLLSHAHAPLHGLAALSPFCPDAKKEAG